MVGQSRIGCYRILSGHEAEQRGYVTLVYL